MSPDQQTMSMDGGPHRGALVRPRGYKQGRCRYGCIEPAMWVTLVDDLGTVRTHPDSGKPRMVLVNLGAIATGTVILEGHGRARMKHGTVWVPPDELYEVHYATCPAGSGGRGRRQ